jgi:hypothetical protein
MTNSSSSDSQTGHLPSANLAALIPESIEKSKALLEALRYSSFNLLLLSMIILTFLMLLTILSTTFADAEADEELPRKPSYYWSECE